jgi:hypothetical protein
MEKHSGLDDLYRRFKPIMAESDAQIMFCGAYGGQVTYDGKGGPMEKIGGPIDRIYLLKNSGKMLDYTGLHSFATMNFTTGKLAENVEVTKTRTGRRTRFLFRENRKQNAIEISGAVPDLGLSFGTPLFHSDVERSEMVCTKDEADGKAAILYVAFHGGWELDRSLLKHFRVKPPRGKKVAITLWQKPVWAARGASQEVGPKGIKMKTSQFLAYTRVFLQQT